MTAFESGLQGAGIAACAKHFPGHGDTDLDTHHDLPTMTGDLEAALVPFRAATAAGVRAIMTCHICVPALDGEPATLSRPILTGLLRDELGFEGAILTDALDMKAVSKLVGMDEAAVRSLAAGADGLLLGAGLDERPVATVQRAIVDAVRSGRLDEDRLREAAGRVAAIGAVDAAGAADRDAAAQAAGRAIRTEGAVRLARAPLVVELVSEPSVAAGPQGHGLGQVMAAETVRIAEAAADGLPAVPADRQLVLVLRDAHRHAWEQRAAATLVERAPDAVVVETGLPLWRPRGGAGYVLTHGTGRVNLEAAARVLS